MSKLILSHDDACNVVFEDHSDFTDVPDTEKIEDKSRWETFYSKIVKQKSTGKYYSIDWSRGSTEYQEHGLFDGEDTVELIEVAPVEKTVIVYEPVKV